MRVERCRARCGYTTGAIQPSAYNRVLDSSYLLTQVPLGAFSTLPATLSSAVGLGNFPATTPSPATRCPVRVSAEHF